VAWPPHLVSSVMVKIDGMRPSFRRPHWDIRVGDTPLVVRFDQMGNLDDEKVR